VDSSTLHRRAFRILVAVLAAVATTAAAAGSAFGAEGPDSPKAGGPAGASAAAPTLGIAALAAGDTTVTYDAGARKVKLQVDDGYDLDQYLFADSSPLDFVLDLKGFKPKPGESVPITLRVWDVDQGGAPGFPECAVEVDKVTVNGAYVGDLTGADSQWSIVTLTIPAGVLTSGANTVAVDIDVATRECWAVQVDYASVELPFSIAQLEAKATDDVTIRRGTTDAVIADSIWKTSFAADGSVVLPASPDDPVADSFASAGSFTYRYAVDAWPARPDFAPTVKYSWEIPGTGVSSGGFQELTGWENSFAVTMPGKVGKHSLTVVLKIYREDELLTTETRTHTLYSLYGTPPASASSPSSTTATAQPRTAWLDVATTWANGKATQEEILGALNGAEYGNPFGWGYGYPKQTDPVVMIESGAGANGDCFTFRDVLGVLAASLGITTSWSEYRPPSGFMTSTRPALDGNASANSLHASTGTRDRWLFGNHQYRTFGGKIYDPTFGLVGANTTAGKEGNVYCKITGSGGGFIRCALRVPPPAEALIEPTPVGTVNGWSIMRYHNPHPAGIAAAGGQATIAGLAEHGDDSDGNGLYDNLVVDVGVDVTVGGDFGFIAALTDAAGNVVAIGDLGTIPFGSAPERSATLAPGHHTVPVYFGGRAIRESGADGPYGVAIELYDAGSVQLDAATATTGPYDNRQFQGAPVELGAIADRTVGGSLRLEIATDAAAAGDVTVQAQVFAGEEYVTDVVADRHLTAGAQTVVVDVPGDAISATGLDGPYTVYLSVSDATSNAEATHTTAAYRASDFDRPRAYFAGPTTDAATAERLTVTASTAASEPGTYTLRGVLRDAAGAFVAADAVEAVLGASPSALELAFAGTAIRRHGVDGPYTVVLALVDGPGVAVSGTDHVTAAYAHTAFERSAALFTGSVADRGEDTDGNGLFDVLRVDVGLDVAEAGMYVVEGSLATASGLQITNARAEAFLAAGARTLILRFDGAAIRASDADGPYRLQGLELVGAEGSLDSLATRSTGAYSHTAFQGIGVALTGVFADRAVDVDGDGLYDRVDVDVQLTVGQSDFYSFNARLVDSSGEEIVWARGSQFLSAGTRTVTLRFDGRYVYGNGVDGPYDLTNLSIYSNRHTLTENDVHRTSAYRAADFERAGVVRGTVLAGSQPVVGANVFIGGVDGDFTDASGAYRLVIVNGGFHDVVLDAGDVEGPWQILVDGTPAGEGTSIRLNVVVGAETEVSFVAGSVDDEPPVTTATATPAPNAAGWNDGDVRVDLAATDNEAVEEIRYELAGAETGSGVLTGASGFVDVTAEGVTTLTYYAMDEAGNAEKPQTLELRIDRTAPELTLEASPSLLWPPNHKLVPVDIAVAADDALSGLAGFELVSVSSNEPGGEEDIEGFVPGTADTSGLLRAERLGGGDGRVYTLVYRATDLAGNTATATVKVTVPHDHGGTN
jgi:hypothetical protein